MPLNTPLFHLVTDITIIVALTLIALADRRRLLRVIDAKNRLIDNLRATLRHSIEKDNLILEIEEEETEKEKSTVQ